MKKILKLAEAFLKLAKIGEYELPDNHLFGLEVPVGGSNCAKCRFANPDGKSCSNKYYMDWQKSLGNKTPEVLPVAADRYCCDVFEASDKYKKE